MSKNKFIDFRAVKAAITMERALEHYGLLGQFKRGKDSLSGPCPIHKGNNPTQFRVSISKDVWNCFSECKHGGNVLDFIAKMEDVSIHAAALKAIEWFNLDAEEMSADSEEDPEKLHDVSSEKSLPRRRKTSAPEEENTAPNKPLKFRLDKLQRDHPYLAERGLTIETVIDFGIGYCGKGVMAGRIAIPVHSPSGEVVAYAGRFPGEPGEDTPKYKLPQGFRKSLELFNIDRARQEPEDVPLIVVEGFFGCMMLHQLGHRKVVALMGSTLSSAQEELIQRNTGSHSLIIVMLDEDEAGQAGREDAALRLSRFAFVKIHAFGKEGMQPEDLTREGLEEVTGGAL